MNILSAINILILISTHSPLSFPSLQAPGKLKANTNFRWQKRPNHAANVALLEACSIDARNYANEKFTDVKEALMKGANPNCHDKSGCTPLMLEAERGHVRSTILLLRYGASVNLADSGGNTALIFASSSANWSKPIVVALLQYGASVKHRDKAGHDALYYARDSHNHRIVSILQEHLHKSDGLVRRRRH